MILAQFATPPEGLEYGSFAPLVWIAILYGVLFVASRTVGARGNEERAATLENLSFVVMLIAGVYTAGLAIYSLYQRSELIVDMIEIVFVVAVFFTLLITVMLLIELLVGGFGRSRADRRRALAEQPPADPSSPTS